MPTIFLYILRKSTMSATVLLLFCYTLISLLRLGAGKHQKMRTLRPAGILHAEKNGEELGAVPLEKGDFLLGNKRWVPEPNYIRMIEDDKGGLPWLLRLEVKSSGLTLTVLEGEAEAAGRILLSGSRPFRAEEFYINDCTYFFVQND